jgi:hypothetical protein
MPMLRCPPGTGDDWRDSSQTTKLVDRIQWRSSATITLTVHPWHGETVGVLRRFGSNGVWIERASGERRVLPESWTSLVPRVPSRLAGGRAIRIAPETALELAQWVAARLDPTNKDRAR